MDLFFDQVTIVVHLFVLEHIVNHTTWNAPVIRDMLILLNVRSCYDRVTWNAHLNLGIRYHNYATGTVPIVTIIYYKRA